MESPCIHICRMDEGNRLCEGCGRTRLEIAAWSSMTQAEQSEVIEVLPRRMELFRAALGIVENK